MQNAFDVIVIGIGAMGSAACYHLARRGLRVLGIEQFDIPHNRGSSHGLSRMIRSAYYEHPDYVPLIRRAFQLWDELEAEAGRRILHKTGGIYMGEPDGGLIAGSLTSARQHAIAHEALSHRQLASRFPQFLLPERFVGFYEHDAGYLVPESAIRAHADLAVRHGAVIQCNEPVQRWESDDRGVAITTARGTYCADQLIITAGAWADRLMTDLGVPLIVTRQPLAWFEPLRRDPFVPGTLPVWAISPDDTSGLCYGFPLAPEGLKVAHHFPGEPATPDTLDRSPRPADEAPLRQAIRRYMPDADGPLREIRICMYTNSPDHHFILDRHPHHSRLTFAAGFSGHGFKFASVIGEALADLATQETTSLPVRFLGLHRFAKTC